MSEETLLRNLAVEQRRRLIGTIMTAVDKDLNLREEVRLAFRDKVIQAVGAYHDVMLDCLKASTSDGLIINEEFFAAVQRLEVVTARLERQDD